MFANNNKRKNVQKIVCDRVNKILALVVNENIQGKYTEKKRLVKSNKIYLNQRNKSVIYARQNILLKEEK